MDKTNLDVLAGHAAGLSLVGKFMFGLTLLPYIAAAFAIGWFAMRYYEKFTGKTIGKKPIDS